MENSFLIKINHVLRDQEASDPDRNTDVVFPT